MIKIHTFYFYAKIKMESMDIFIDLLIAQNIDLSNIISILKGRYSLMAKIPSPEIKRYIINILSNDNGYINNLINKLIVINNITNTSSIYNTQLTDVFTNVYRYADINTKGNIRSLNQSIYNTLNIIKLLDQNSIYMTILEKREYLKSLIRSGDIDKLYLFILLNPKFDYNFIVDEFESPNVANYAVNYERLNILRILLDIQSFKEYLLTKSKNDIWNTIHLTLLVKELVSEVHLNMAKIIINKYPSLLNEYVSWTYIRNGRPSVPSYISIKNLLDKVLKK